MNPERHKRTMLCKLVWNPRKRPFKGSSSSTSEFLSFTPGNEADIVNRVHRVHEDMAYLFQSGCIVLKEYLSKMRDEDFVITRYEDKNKPICSSVMQMGTLLLDRGLYPITEEYWNQIDQEIVNFNTNMGKRVNRGIPLANIGVAQIAQGKVIEGLFNLYRAYEDDRICLQHLSGIAIDPGRDLSKSILYSQFEEKQIRQLFNIIVSRFNSVFAKRVTIEDLKDFVLGLSPDKKLLFYVILYRFSFAFVLNSDLTNPISRSEIIRSLAEMALWFEDELKQKDNILSGFTLVQIIELKMGEYLNSARGEYTSAKSLTELTNKITKAITVSTRLELTNARIIGCLRNFASHNLEVQNHQFFQYSDEVFARILSFILYSKEQGWI